MHIGLCQSEAMSRAGSHIDPNCIGGQLHNGVTWLPKGNYECYLKRKTEKGKNTVMAARQATNKGA